MHPSGSFFVEGGEERGCRLWAAMKVSEYDLVNFDKVFVEPLLASE